MHKLRIAMCFSADASTAGGVQEHVFHLSRSLMARGHTVHIFGPEKPALPYENYHVSNRSFPVPLPNGNQGSVSIGIDQNSTIGKQIDKKHFDICHIHEPYVPFFLWQVAQAVTVPKVASFHSGWDKDSLANMLNPILPFFKDTFSQYIDAAVFVSRISKKRWESMCSKKVVQEIIPNGIDHRIFYPIKKGQNTHVNLLFLARLVSRKGLEYLLKALVKLPSSYLSKIQLKIIGEGPERRWLEQYVKGHKLKTNVHFLGEIIGEKRVLYYQQADVFCAPYVDEAFAITILEAMACGCAIVGFKNEAFREVLKDYPGKVFITRPKDINELVKSLKKIIDDVEKRNHLSTWCLNESKKYDWDMVAEKTEKIYRKITNFQ